MWLKAFSTTAFMSVFFVAYFAVLRHPLMPVTVMPLIPLDAWVAFTPYAFPVYASLWIYVSLPPALFVSARPLYLFGGWIAAMCLFCLAIFWLVPTAIPPAGIDWTQYPEMAFMKDLDATGNACPSLHVASAVFSAFWLARLFRTVGTPRWMGHASLLSCLAILWSTVAIRQHVMLDVLAGALVGSAFALLSLRHVGRAVPAGV